MSEYSIAGKQLKLDGAKDVEFLVNDLKSMSDVTKIDLSGNTIGIESAKAISEALVQFKSSLTEINLSDIFTGRLNTEVPQCLNHLLPTLLECPKLSTINLSDNALGLQTIEPIENYLAKAVTLDHLILSNNGMGPFSGERIGKALYKLSKLKQTHNKPSLKTFVCGRNRLENGSMKYLTLGLINHKDLETLQLYQNGIRPKGIAILINGLSSNKNLKLLDLQDNTLTFKGSNAIAENLKHWEQLSELNLNDCLLKSKGLSKIVAALTSTEKVNINVLKLQYNELNKKSLTDLYDAIKGGKLELTKLEINGNMLDDDDELIEQFQELFEDKEIDELDEMEGEDSDEEEEEEEEEDEEDDSNVVIDFNALAKSEDEKAVDELTGDLEKTHIK